MALVSSILVVGLGSIGRRHARLLQEQDDLEVRLCDASEPALSSAAEELGIDSSRLYSDYAAALAEHPDAVLIASPHSLHVTQVLAALDAGAHVLCEKPVSDSVSNALALLPARQDRVLVFGFHLHFHPGVQYLRQLIDEGMLGRIVHLSAHVGSAITLRNSLSRYQSTLRGALLMDYTHQADLACYLLDAAPESVYAHGIEVPEPQLQSSPMLIDAIVKFPGERSAAIHLNYLQDPDREDLEVIGTEGWALLDTKRGRLRWGTKANPEQVNSEVIRPERDDIYRAEHRAFFDAVAGTRAPESPLSTAILSQYVTEAALASLDSGQVERVSLSQ